jgi:hypothetical protein
MSGPAEPGQGGTTNGPARPAAAGPTSDEIRGAIDSGRTRDKVAYPDPAAAPLGSDAEAAGTPPSRPARRAAAAPVGPPEREPLRGSTAMILIVGGLLLISAILVIAGVAGYMRTF